MKTIAIPLLLSLSVLVGCATYQAQQAGLTAGTTSPPANNALRLYALDCGTMDFPDISAFSNQGKFDGVALSLVDPCFLLRHPKGDLLWDIGLDQSLVDNPNGIQTEAIHMRMTTKLTDQLEQLDLPPSGIEFLAISHSHPDHLGNAHLFPEATFLVHEAERAFMFSEAMQGLREQGAEAYAALERATTVTYKDHHDVFGDGSVVMKAMPGHTPGHAVLLVRLQRSGNVLLTGDLYTHAEARKMRAVPAFNIDPELTLQSMDRFEELASEEKARVVIQHDKDSFESLPTFPGYLD
ncbi:MAG: N-acyl homoserine lactonase family protein [Deltaproteobacteria bacterium]|nr:N-acyl homoserine lactonase family protein [Deltaproteobacteria bacterium]